MIRASLLILKHLILNKDKAQAQTFSTWVMPWHLDLNGHVNNGQYYSYANQARLVFLVENKMHKILLQNGLKPVISEQIMNYYRPLKLGQRVEVKSEIKEVQKDKIMMEQNFYVEKEKVAQLISSIKLIKKNKRIDHLKIYHEYKQ